ncbi:MAG TPA: hypothetical protein VFF06_06685, partial [Polyangia bacterium]|nr:hypothetical protein [Polyangia bacterium]
QIVDEMVKVASRPVELDLLSGASLVQFARIYGQLVAEQRGETPLKWAHLGDWGDMGCRSELDRVAGYVKLFAKHGAVAALAPGNHDSTFVGNFTWHPAWDEACATQDKLTSIVDKLDTNQRLAALSGAAAKPHGLGEKSWLASAASIATGPTRVTAAFLDTSDYTGFTIGFAGVQGSVSRAQADDVVAKVNAVSSDGPVVLLMHHTYDELSKWGQYNVDRIVSKLGTRVIGLVAAHTHMVGQRRRKFGARCLPELVVGSTTDPPQEAALLEIFPDAGASYSLSLSTIPAVSRSPESDGDLKHFHAPGDASSAYVTGDDCRDAFAALRKRSDACRELFTPAPIMRQCLLTPEENREEAARLSRGESPLALDAGERTPGTPEQLKCEQEWRARRLLACIEPGAAPPDGEVLAPSNAKLFELVDARLADEGERVNVVCLGWAASILQGHKSEHWDFQDALAYAREGSVAAPAEHLTGRPEECTAP